MKKLVIIASLMLHNLPAGPDEPQQLLAAVLDGAIKAGALAVVCHQIIKGNVSHPKLVSGGTAVVVVGFNEWCKGTFLKGDFSEKFKDVGRTTLGAATGVGIAKFMGLGTQETIQYAAYGALGWKLITINQN